MWEAATGKELARLEGHGGRVVSAAWSPDGARIVTASSDKTARVWEAATGKKMARLEGHGDAVRSAAWSPDGGRIVTAFLREPVAARGSRRLRVDGEIAR